MNVNVDIVHYANPTTMQRGKMRKKMLKRNQKILQRRLNSIIRRIEEEVLRYYTSNGSTHTHSLTFSNSAQ